MSSVSPVRTIYTSRMAHKINQFNGEWLREANPWEQMMETAHKHQSFLTWQQLHLKSKAPLQERHVKETLSHLHRRVPSLGLAFSYKNEKLWLKRATNANVDFKVLQNKTVEEIRDILCTKRYCTETGPLFCNILLKDALDKNIDPEDLDSDMKHSYYLFFGFHHAVNDGKCSCLISRYFISMLNDVIQGNPVDDSEPLGTFLIEDETEKLIRKAKEVIKDGQCLKEKQAYEKELTEKDPPSIIMGFNAPQEKRRTVGITKILDINTSSKFLIKCKLENVTVNSAFTALVNAALVDILIQNNFLRDTYRIQNFHLVDLRRYWHAQVPHALGCHIRGPLKMFTDTPRTFGDQFWDYARSLHQNIQKDIESGKIIFDIAFRTLNSDGPPMTEDYMLSKKPYDGDFVISNLGDITKLITEGGEHVKINHFLAGTAVHLNGKPITIYCNTFRGKFSMVFEYNAEAVDKDVAEKFFSQILKRLVGAVE